MMPVGLIKCLVLLLFCFLATANIEKIVFVAPDGGHMPLDASVDNLMLMTLDASQSSRRTFVNASFPTETAKKGAETWLVLDGLKSGQRYELRIIWIATVRRVISRHSLQC